MAAAAEESSVDSENRPESIRLHVSTRYIVLPSMGALTGLFIGIVRGSRKESLRFLAENAHRPPTTLQGWYFYKKTKNYRMMLAALREGGARSIRLGAVGLAWAGLEDGMQRAGLEDVREIGAGLCTAGIIAGLCKQHSAAEFSHLCLLFLICDCD